MEPIKGELRLSLEQDTEKHESSSGTKQKSESSILEEELYLQTQGDVFDPRLMTYMAGLGFGLNQQGFESETQSSNTSGTMNSYRLNMNFLTTKPYPFSIDTRKSNMLVGRRFQSPLRAENTTTGVSLRLRNPDWPMTFRWTSSEIEQKSDINTAEDFFNRSSDSFSYSLLHDFSERSHLTFRSDWDEVTQKSQNFLRNTETIRNRLLHDFHFGSHHQHDLSSSFSFVETTGDFENEILEWNEYMHLMHSEKFSTFYNTFLSQSTFASIENQTIAGMAGFNHQLYRNLNTSFNVFANNSEFGSNSETTSRGGNLNFDYTRNNPWGLLSSDYSINMTTQESTSETGTGIAIDESHDFDKSFPYITLNERNIVVDTIVVTNVAGNEVYTEGDDYTVSVINGRVELTVTDLGTDIPNISDSQELLVDYLFEIEDSRQEDMVNQFFRIKQEFNNGVSVFYSRRDRNSQVDSDLDTTVSDREYITDTYGIGYRNKYVTLRAEHSDTRSDENSSEADIVSARCFWPLTSRTSLHGLVSQSWLESSGDNSRETSLFRAEGRIKTRLTRNLRLSGSAELRNEDSSDRGPTDGFKTGVALQYNRRALSIRAGWDSYFLDRYNTERNGSRFYITLTRRF
ncbi:MAG: hypothetical protein ACYSYU_00730 [Planctomycetota bacterium]|jgi:hypothetical protein